MSSLFSLMLGGDLYGAPDDFFDEGPDYTNLIEENGLDDPDHEDRRKEWLENYAAEAAGFTSRDKDELPC